MTICLNTKRDAAIRLCCFDCAKHHRQALDIVSANGVWHAAIAHTVYKLADQAVVARILVRCGRIGEGQIVLPIQELAMLAW